MGKPPSTTGKAAKITLEVLQDHFHLPMAEVAKKFDVCLTYFKRVCRSHGVNRWPYRKIKSLQMMSPSVEDDSAANHRRESMAFCTMPRVPSVRRAGRQMHGQLMSVEMNAERMDDSDYAAADSRSNTSSEADEHSAASCEESATPTRGIKRLRGEVDDGTPSAMDILVMAALGDRQPKSRRMEEPKQEPRQQPRPEFMLRPPSSFPTLNTERLDQAPMSHLRYEAMQFAQALASTSGPDRLPPMLPTSSVNVQSAAVQSAALQNYWHMVGAQMPASNFFQSSHPNFASPPVSQQLVWS